MKPLCIQALVGTPLGLTFKEKGMKCLLHFGIHLHEERYVCSIDF